MKFPALRAGLPGKVVSFYIVPLGPVLKGGLAGHVLVTQKATFCFLLFGQSFNIHKVCCFTSIRLPFAWGISALFMKNISETLLRIIRK